MRSLVSVCLTLFARHAALAASLAAPAPPKVTLDAGTFLGTVDGLAHRFTGIPFAQPPIGDLRLRLPVAPPPYTGTHNATAFGLACTQLPSGPDFPASIASNVTAFFDGMAPPQSGEDCLTINVWTPAGVAPGAKLPVVVWIYGGGFTMGSTGAFNGSAVVSRSVEMGTPVVYVSMNYRLSVFGFLASKEVMDARVGNLGLQDQRLALHWVQKYVHAFAGDPTKVTIWGESAGAVSVAMHLVANRGAAQGLFRGAFMNSGSPLSTGDLTHAQQFYDSVVADTGCAGARDTLQCLREAPFEVLQSAAMALPGLFTPQSLNIPFNPRADGVFITDNPQTLVARGEIADVPFVNGDCDDEGTLFTIQLLNITTEAELRTYLATIYLPGATPAELDDVLRLYPQDPAQGSPFGTGAANALSPQFKRLAAIQGDLIFQAERRFLLAQRAGKQRVFSYLNKRLKATPGLGSAHATDLLNVYGPGDMTDYLVNFVNNLDPNGPGLLHWPAFTEAERQLLTFQDGDVPLAISLDDFRAEGMALFTRLLQATPF
ncbi:Lipase 4 [Phanerochaete sordida]|uniref:Lipase 4 n=1 Tax=Phanerochaete sordida TaxID=48140 RepID=A0A9P3LFF6_9APHY|nr:Lipase 4 [Phanerochaete sordida]